MDFIRSYFIRNILIFLLIGLLNNTDKMKAKDNSHFVN